MDLGHDGHKRQRLSWSAPSPQALHPQHYHHGPVPAPNLPPTIKNLPRPSSHAPSPQGHQHHLPPVITATGPYSSYPPRPTESPSTATPTQPYPTTVSLPPPSETDRRYNEPEPHGSMPDHYRHPPQPSPVHHQPVFSPRTEPTVKREPADSHRRPSASGHAVEPSANGPHGGPPPQHSHHTLPPPSPSYHEGQQRHMAYEGSNSMPPTPGGYRPSSFPPPTPISQQQQQQWDGQGSYSTQGDGYYGTYPQATTTPTTGPSSAAAAAAAAANKKKNTRASQACEQCRHLKAKCDETKPCKTCRDKGLDCRYREPAPKPTDKAQAEILEGISAIQSSITTMTSFISKLDERLTVMESSSRAESKLNGVKREPVTNERQGLLPPSPEAMNGVEGAHYYNRGHDDNMNAEPPNVRMTDEDDFEPEPGPPLPPGEPAIPMNHTTLAGLLLDWPGIRDITRAHVEKEGVRYVSEYPIAQEKSRGVISMYGQGEDSHHSRVSREQVEQGNFDGADDASSDTPSPSPAADFGLVSALSPMDNFEYRGGVLGSDGSLDLSDQKVWSYVDSFTEHILSMHPVVKPKTLHSWVSQFLASLPPGSQAKTTESHLSKSFAVDRDGQMPSEVAGTKRKRSPEREASETTKESSTPKESSTAKEQSTPKEPSGPRFAIPDRSVHSALVLTILALGKICQHRDYVPDVVHRPADMPFMASPAIHNGILPSPSQGSPPVPSSQSVPSGMPSPREHERGRHSRRPSLQGPTSRPYTIKRNIDVIPGLEYFAYATDILGNRFGSYNNLKDVYANIFAGLYYGQLARPLESFAYVHRAAHVLQVIMRPSLDKLKKIKENREFLRDNRYNQLMIAFWTLLQLESDLIAELPLPPSGLLSYEEDMPFPSMMLLDGYDPKVLDSYPGQLYLRKHLNSIHRMFYSPEDPTSAKDNDAMQFKNVGLVADAVSTMQWVAPRFAFSENDPPADDILSVRLRAKYWGAQNITYRPFIRQILQFSDSMKKHPTSPQFPAVSEFRHGVVAPVIHPNTKSHGELDPEIVELAKRGVKALIESTRSFHNLGDKRPIITNVFGTAHAQWGNLLVLTAAHKDPILQKFVDEDLLRTLYTRTIAFLRQSAPASSSLRIDMRILEGIYKDLFHPHDIRTGSSFSSHTSMHTPASAPPLMSHASHDSLMAPPMNGK